MASQYIYIYKTHTFLKVKEIQDALPSILPRYIAIMILKNKMLFHACYGFNSLMISQNILSNVSLCTNEFATLSINVFNETFGCLYQVSVFILKHVLIPTMIMSFKMH